MTSTQVRLVLLIILALGAGLRVAYLLEVRDHPDFERPVIDAAFHDYWARGIASGDWNPPAAFTDPQVRTAPFFRPPGYPFVLAGVYQVFGQGYLAPRLFQMALGLASVLLAFLFARGWLGAIPALLVAAGMSVYWVFIYFEMELQAETLFVFLLLAFLNAVGLWYRRRTFAVALAAGVLSGMAALVRPNFLAILAATPIWIVAVQWGEKNRRVTLLAVVGLVVGAVLAIAPATIRNYVVSARFVPISTNSGINLYIGNNPRADGFVALELEGLGTFGTSFDWPGIVRTLEQRVGHELDDVDADAYFMREGLAFISANPGRFAELTLKKALLFWGPAEVGHNKEVHYERAFSPLLSHLPGRFSLLATLALLGLGLMATERDRARRALAALTALVGAAYFVSVLPFFAAARYRVPVLPILILFAGWAVYRFARTLLARRWRFAALGLVGFAAAFFVANRPLVDYTPSVARWYYDRAVAFEAVDEPERALADYRSALRADPTQFYARYNLGHLLVSMGRPDEAVVQWEAALMARRNYAPTHYNLALAYEELGQKALAMAHLERALALRPKSSEYRAKMAELRALD